jgi:Tfp pilus assembly protein PilF
MRASRLAALSLAIVVLAAACAPAKKGRTPAEILLTQRMAQVLLRDGHPVDAEKAFRDVLRDDPKNPEVLDGLGVSLVMQGRYQDALPSLQKAVQLAPQNGSYRNNLGVAQMELGQFAEASLAFAAAEASPNSDDRISAAINRGRLAQRKGDLAGAEQEFTLAMARDPKSFAATFGRGVARENRSELEGAAEDYLAALKLQPSNAEANLRLGLCLVSLQKLDLGRRYLQRAIDLDPNGETGTKARMLLAQSKTP